MVKNLVVLVVGVALGVGGAIAVHHFGSHRHIEFGSVYQAVLLDNGQVFFGKIEGADTGFPILTNVYYIQNKVDPQTKVVTNILVRRGKEWHSPDRMVLNSRHVILMEPVGSNSQVAKLIAENEQH